MFKTTNSVSDVYMICNAYESGVSHGVLDDYLINPFIPFSIEHEAYGYGVAEGLEQKFELESTEGIIL